MGETVGEQNTFYSVNAQKRLHLVPINWGLRLLRTPSSGPQNQMDCQIVVFLQVYNVLMVYMTEKYLCRDGKQSDIYGVGQHLINLYMVSVVKHCGSQWSHLSLSFAGCIRNTDFKNADLVQQLVRILTF